jgi:ABC-type ATPase involved in cell division
VTLGVASGELIVVEGPAASGKSTLLEVAAVARLPDAGAVWFAGRKLATLQRASLPYVRRNIGYCTADPLLILEDSVLANVMLALAVRGEAPQTAERVAREALDMVAIGELASRTVRSLSSGQRRLVALARAIAGPPPVVVADEPGATTGDLGLQTVVHALAAARDRGAAVLCATANSMLANELVGIGGRRIHLAQGRIAGAPAIGLVPGSPEPSYEGEPSPAKLVPLAMDGGDVRGDLPTAAPAAKEPR